MDKKAYPLKVIAIHTTTTRDAMHGYQSRLLSRPQPQQCRLPFLSFLQFVQSLSLVPHQDMYTSSLQHLRAAASTPLRLAPVGGTAEVDASAAKVAARAAQSSSTPGVDDWAAGIAGIGNLGGGGGVWWGLLVECTVAEAALAASTAVNSLVLDIILRTTVSGRATAAIIVTVGSGAGASHTTLGASANIDVRDRGDIRAAWGG